MTGIDRSFDRSGLGSDMPGAMAYRLLLLHAGRGSTMTGGSNSRPARDGATVADGCERHVDEIASEDETLLSRKRIVLDSSRIGTLLVIPL
jgi:hypothetical protein